jgi:hypothetical protein
VHLAHKLPEIEHLADLAHELTHATRLRPEVLRGDVASAKEFVEQRLTGQGGEADAFVAECNVKHELLGHWDAFCSTYVSENEMNRQRVIRDLYNGVLSASLTGESYPTLLERQYRLLHLRKSDAAANRYSGLVNKPKVN